MKSVLIQSMTLESGVGVGVQTEGESKERVESLEKDLAYYRQTNKDLKQKLREFVMVHEKQMQALERAKERRLKLKSENEQLAKALDELKVAYISVENFINVLDFA
jgi:chromosome segregation ATPase